MDLPRKRAVIIGKGGHKEYVFWASGAARLLSRYLAGRRRGPNFLTHRRPNVIPARGDECPHTGRGRLSYERASTIFKQASGGFTLHQLRHSSLTHLAETGASTILLQAKSRHQDPRTLAIYTRPGNEAIAELTAAHGFRLIPRSPFPKVSAATAPLKAGKGRRLHRPKVPIGYSLGQSQTMTRRYKI